MNNKKKRKRESIMKNLKELYDYRQMIFSLVKKDLRGRYKGSALGFLWTFLNPLLQLVVYSIVFSTIFRNNIEKFYLYLIHRPAGPDVLLLFPDRRFCQRHQLEGHGEEDLFPA